MKRYQWAGVALAAAVLACWLSAAAFSPLSPGDPVNPAQTPADVKPEWYFLALYQLLHIVPERVAVLIPGMVAGLLVALPYIAPTADGQRRRIVRAATVIGVLLYALLTLAGNTV